MSAYECLRSQDSSVGSQAGLAGGVAGEPSLILEQTRR